MEVLNTQGARTNSSAVMPLLLYVSLIELELRRLYPILLLSVTLLATIMVRATWPLASIDQAEGQK